MQVCDRLWNGTHDILANERDSSIWTQFTLHILIRAFHHPVRADSTSQQLCRPAGPTIPDGVYGFPMLGHRRSYDARSLLTAEVAIRTHGMGKLPRPLRLNASFGCVFFPLKYSDSLRSRFMRTVRYHAPELRLQLINSGTHAMLSRLTCYPRHT
jgi:hypothetical protein